MKITFYIDRLVKVLLIKYILLLSYPRSFKPIAPFRKKAARIIKKNICALTIYCILISSPISPKKNLLFGCWDFQAKKKKMNCM